MRRRIRADSISSWDDGVRPLSSSVARTAKRALSRRVHSRSSLIAKAPCT